MVFSTFRAWTPPSEGHVLSGWSQSATSSSAKCTPGSSWPTWGRRGTNKSPVPGGREGVICCFVLVDEKLLKSRWTWLVVGTWWIYLHQKLRVFHPLSPMHWFCVTEPRAGRCFQMGGQCSVDFVPGAAENIGSVKKNHQVMFWVMLHA